MTSGTERGARIDMRAPPAPSMNRWSRLLYESIVRFTAVSSRLRSVGYCFDSEPRKFTAKDAMVRVPITRALSSTKKPGLWFGAAFAGS